ncbi:MAG: type II toxin-antitoxin system PemK/MazF family toxin [Lachnospiraceae bacterium]|nr:type II toxin-antitoxin system PemK/MazF family toxin [Lachnospiraceae bacterium]
MEQKLYQGDILKIEKIKHPVLVVSKDFFNTSGEIIGCPIIKSSMPGPLHIWMSTENAEGYIQCEKLALLDMSVRGYRKIDRLPISEIINVSDAIQGIFEYI